MNSETICVYIGRNLKYNVMYVGFVVNDYSKFELQKEYDIIEYNSIEQYELKPSASLMLDIKHARQLWGRLFRRGWKRI